MSKNGECVRVMVRIRPLSNKEKQDGREIVTTANAKRAEISIVNPEADKSEPPKTFTFDATFPAGSSQREVYDSAATEIVEAVMEGYNGTVFAYGQTGAGKSHTMEGYPEPAELRGIIPNSFRHIFEKVAIATNKQFLVRASYLEIYNEEVRDLLSKDPKNNLELKENPETGVYVKGLTSMPVKDAAEIDHVMQAGKKNRSVGATLMNQTSSRSHSIFTIVVECAGKGLTGEDHLCMGKLNLVDLAGSERQSKTGATGDRLKEATKINLSLSALGNVISALVESKSNHIPYRDSKLTRLLQDSLGGNTKTVMIANCGPAGYNFEETATTLRYASRAKNIKNKPKINEDPKDAMLREYQDEINALKARLAAGGGLVTAIVDGKEVTVPASAQPKEVIEVEKIVEKVVIEKGLTPEQAADMQAKATREKEKIQNYAKKKLDMASKDIELAAESKREMEAKLAAEHAKHEEWAKEQQTLKDQLAQMENKVLSGGEMMSKAAEQENALRQATLDLQDKKRQELQLARELAEREESNLMMEEQYTSLQEEAEEKTKKLKKVWTKVKEVLGEVKQVRAGLNREREDLLETIRGHAAQIQLETLILKYYIPDEELLDIENSATWIEDDDEWEIPRLELAGNNTKTRPTSSSIRPETKSRRNSFSELNPASPLHDTAARNPYYAYTNDMEGYALACDVSSKPAKSKRSKRPTTARNR